jgi:hypothetical protein
LTGDQTDEVLSAVAPHVLRGGRRAGGFLSEIAKKQAWVLLALLVSGLTVQAASGRWSGPTVGDGPGFVNPANAGYLKVSADPWAHVDVDGERVLTTPAARAIPLKPGRHYVKYINPYFLPVEHQILIEAGNTVHDRAKLTEQATMPEGNGSP